MYFYQRIKEVWIGGLLLDLPIDQVADLLTDDVVGAGHEVTLKTYHGETIKGQINEIGFERMKGFLVVK